MGWQPCVKDALETSQHRPPLMKIRDCTKIDIDRSIQIILRKRKYHICHQVRVNDKTSVYF